MYTQFGAPWPFEGGVIMPNRQLAFGVSILMQMSVKLRRT